MSFEQKYQVLSGFPLTVSLVLFIAFLQLLFLRIVLEAFIVLFNAAKTLEEIRDTLNAKK